MAEIGLRTRMLVKDVMSSPVVTVPENMYIDNLNMKGGVSGSLRVGSGAIVNIDDLDMGIVTKIDKASISLRGCIIFGVLNFITVYSQLKKEKARPQPLRLTHQASNP